MTSAPAASDAGQLDFLNKLQRILDEGQFVASYKYTEPVQAAAMPTLTIRLDERLDRELTQLAKQTGQTKSEVVRERVQYWTALALLRGVMSSPAAGIEMLNTRLENLAAAAGDDAATSDNARDAEANSVDDTEFGFEGENAPTQVIERNDWTEHQRRRLREFAQELAGLSNIKHDSKLASAELIIDDWLGRGFNPVVFCRYIATANYVGAHERFSALMDRQRFQVVYPVLPMDLLGVYVLLPE